MGTVRRGCYQDVMKSLEKKIPPKQTSFAELNRDFEQ